MKKVLFSKIIPGMALTALTAFFLVIAGKNAAARRIHTSMGFAMNTVVTQTAYGKNAEQAMQAVTGELAALEARLSPYSEGSEIAQLNLVAGEAAVTLSDETFALLQRSIELSAGSDRYFQLTVAPLTALWSITGDHPSVPSQQAIDAVLPLIDDTTLKLDLENRTAFLPIAGQAIDLGGIAKGYACDRMRQVYLQNGVDHALLSVGGNLCCVGGLPNGQPFRIGFRDPLGNEDAYVASFLLTDGTVAVSGGYERYFEQDGKRYHHILDPHTGYPAETDILSVGVVSPDGTAADFWSTTLFSWGSEKALTWMKSAPYEVLLLTEDGTLYVTDTLQPGFELNDTSLKVLFVSQQ